MSLKDLLPGTNIKILNNLGTYDSGVVIEKAKSTCVSNLYYVKWRQDGTITLQQIYKRDVNEPRTNSSKNSDGSVLIESGSESSRRSSLTKSKRKEKSEEKT